MNDQEKKIIYLLLNEMAFEGATKHFQEAAPEIDRGLFDKLHAIGLPQKYDGNFKCYVPVDAIYDENCSAYDNCYRCLRLIRNNIIHANKAVKPDTPERLGELLDWSEEFIDAVYATTSRFADRAREIKAVLRIEAF